MKTATREIKLVENDGTLTDEGIKIHLDPTLTPAQREALRAQALRQEVYGFGAAYPESANGQTHQG